MAAFFPLSSTNGSPKPSTIPSRVTVAGRVRKARARASRMGYNQGVALGIGSGLEVLSRETTQVLLELQAATASHVWELTSQVVEELLTSLPEAVTEMLPSQIARVTKDLVYPGIDKISMHPEDIQYLESLKVTPPAVAPKRDIRIGTAEIQVGTATITIDWRNHLKRLHHANKTRNFGIDSPQRCDSKRKHHLQLGSSL